MHDHPQIDPMQPQSPKGIGQDQADGLAPEPFPKLRNIIKPDRQTRPSVMFVEAVRAHFPQKSVLNIDSPTQGVRQSPLNPSPCFVFANRRKALRISPEAAHNFR